MRRTPLRRKTQLQPGLNAGLRRRRPLRTATAKKRQEYRALDAARDAVKERSGGMCEARIEGVCLGRGRHAHHVQLRAQGGKHTPDNLRWLCEMCHSWAHSNPKQAAERGLMTLRGSA